MTRGAGVGTPFTAEVRIISFNFPPKNWAFCNGQLQAIQQNQALFSLIGTSYGGNGTQTFALPNRSLANTGPISTADYDAWKLNFGAHAGGSAGATVNGAVPEPASSVVLMTAAAGWCLKRGWAAQ